MLSPLLAASDPWLAVSIVLFSVVLGLLYLHIPLRKEHAKLKKKMPDLRYEDWDEGFETLGGPLGVSHFSVYQYSDGWGVELDSNNLKLRLEAEQIEIIILQAMFIARLAHQANINNLDEAVMRACWKTGYSPWGSRNDDGSVMITVDNRKKEALEV